MRLANPPGTKQGCRCMRAHSRDASLFVVCSRHLSGVRLEGGLLAPPSQTSRHGGQAFGQILGPLRKDLTERYPVGHISALWGQCVIL